LVGRRALIWLILLGILGWGGCASRPLLFDVRIIPQVISPNADGRTDVARIAYRLSRSADLSIYFTDSQGQRHYFRRDRRRSAGEYQVDFGGVIEGRMLPDGDYLCVLEATEVGQGNITREERRLTLIEADTVAPELRGFSVYPHTFTPNQDGFDDRVTIEYYLTKPAQVQVFLLGPNDEKYPLAEKEREVKPGEVGAHFYDYEGGVDMKAQPPPSGTYIVWAQAEDEVGNRTTVTDTLTIREGGVPRADIVNLEVDFDPQIVPLGQTLHFTLTVENFGAVPIRTTGPPPGTIYESDVNFNQLEWYEEPGAWRVGIDFETNSSGRPYPFRWALGEDDDLEMRAVDGKPRRYLMPGERAVVTGGIRLKDPPPRNPIYFWAGLIHEEVRIDPFNDHVDAQSISIGF
jgi:hypothetical protein